MREELVAALEARDLTVTVRSDGGLRVVRPGVGLLAEVLTFMDGRPHWSWGAPVDAETASEAADRINTVVSVPPRVTRNSA